MNKNLTWRELKALNDLYVKRRSSAKIQDHPYIKELLERKGLLDRKSANLKVLIPAYGFEVFYEKSFKESFQFYKAFLKESELESDARRTYSEEDIKTLMLIKENKDELKRKLTNIEDFSSKIFDYGGSKYLKNKLSLKKAVYNILDIEEFPLEQKEHQWRLVVDCQEPKAVVLCENKSFLKQPWISKKLNVKLWYVGGNNIRILNDIDETELSKPFYYSCDWDLAGLQIYSRIKMNLKDRNKSIELLYPNEPHHSFPVNSPYHKSKWKKEILLSGLDLKDFNEKEQQLIKQLIIKDEWIEEESTDLSEMIKSVLL